MVSTTAVLGREMRSSFKLIAPSVPKIDYSYQRPLDKKRVDAMANEPDFDLIGTPIVSLRSDGTYWKVDGQHRLAFLIQVGLGNVPIMMQVFEGLTVPEEAKLFWSLQKKRKSTRPVEDFKAALTAKDPQAVAVQAILDKHNCKIYKNSGEGLIRAVDAVMAIYRQGMLNQQNVLNEVLSVIGGWAKYSAKALDGEILRGLCAFLTFYSPDVDTTRFIEKLKENTPAAVLKQIKLQKDDRRGTGATKETAHDAAVYVFKEIYNKKARVRLRGLGEQGEHRRIAAENKKQAQKGPVSTRLLRKVN